MARQLDDFEILGIVRNLINKSIPSAIGDMTDVQLVTPLPDDSILLWSSSHSKWMDAQISDVAITGLFDDLTMVPNFVLSVQVNGAAQTVDENGAVDLDVANNLITQAQWDAIEQILS